MHANSATMPAQGFRPGPVLLGGLLVGTFDLIFACSWWAIARDVPPIRIFQSIAAGVLGDASFAGGMRSALLGGVLHYGIATCMVSAYSLVATRLPLLARQPWHWGPLYGLFLYGVMQFIVLPLSAAGPAKFNAPWILASIVVHMVIGVACAFMARRAVR